MLDHEFLALDAPALMVAALAALCCSVLGNFLVLRKQAMMGDALSHCILPGLVVAYLLSGSLAPSLMLLGAGTSLLLAVASMRALEVYGRIYSGASMAIVLSSFFALGVFFLEVSIGGQVHLDTEHVLYGALELHYWPDPFVWATLPYKVKTLLGLCAVLGVLVTVFFREVRLAIFDQEFASVSGFKPSLILGGLLVAVAIVLVACFDAVGVILVVALLICPAASARLFCDNLKVQILLSMMIGVSCAVLGYILAAKVPLWLGWGHSLGAAGMIAVVLGGVQVLSMLLGPRKI